MKTIMCLITATTITLMTINALADDQNNVVNRVRAGQIAYHFVVSATVPPDGPPLEVVGYIAFIEGVDGPMFADNPCPTAPPLTGCVENAFFTLRVRRFSGGPFTPIVTADPPDVIRAGLITGLLFDVFLDRTPDQEWGNFDSFSNGQHIATFEESTFLNTVNVGGAAFNLFSSTLESSTPVIYHGQTVDFGQLVPNGITSNNFGSMASTSATGSAIAIGGADGDDDDDSDSD